MHSTAMPVMPSPTREAHVAARAEREADVAAEHQLVALALEQVERGDVGADDRGDAPRRLVEQERERHRLGDERRRSRARDRAGASPRAWMVGALAAGAGMRGFGGRRAAIEGCRSIT